MWLNMHYAFLYHSLDWERISLLAIEEKTDAPQRMRFYDLLGSGQQDKLLLENEGHPSQTLKRNGLP